MSNKKSETAAENAAPYYDPIADIGVSSTSGYPACNGSHYEIFSGTKSVSTDGWMYSTCSSCGQRWRTKTIYENVSTVSSIEFVINPKITTGAQHD